MFHDPLVAFNEHAPFSITSMVPSKVWSIHFSLLFVVTTLLIDGPLQFGFDVGWGGTFFFPMLVGLACLSVFCERHSKSWLLFSPWPKPGLSQNL